jgi:tetratricopeptide (TPR) repeat protein
LTIGSLAERTFARLADWQSTQQLFGGALEGEPAYREAYYLLAFDQHRAGRFHEADAHLRPLIDGDPRFAGTASYWNALSAYELDCSNSLALGRPARALALDRRAARESDALRNAPTFHACVGQAHDALGQIPKALEIYLDVARQLGRNTPPRLIALIAHKHLELGRHAEAGSWLNRARAAAAGSPELESYVDQLAAHLARQTSSASK